MGKCRVIYQPAGKTVELDPDSVPDTGEGEPGSLLDIAEAHGIHIEHACGGAGVCATCHVIVQQGEENLSEATDDEMDQIDQAPGTTLHSRLACQAVVRGDVTVLIPEWNRNLTSERH